MMHDGRTGYTAYIMGSGTAGILAPEGATLAATQIHAKYVALPDKGFPSCPPVSAGRQHHDAQAREQFAGMGKGAVRFVGRLGS